MTGVAVSTKKDVGAKLVGKITGEWAPKLTGAAYKGFTAERLAAGFMLAATKEPKLLEGHPTSIVLALGNIARWGLDIGDGAHLVAIPKNIAPRDAPKRYVTFVEAWPDYRGLKALAMRQGIIRAMKEECVYEHDEFHVELGLNEVLKHVPVNHQDKRGKLVGAYSIITLRFGERTFHWMPLEDIEAIRSKSKSWGPNVSKLCPPWYAMKTVVRDWLNRQPKNGALAEALSFDDTSTPMNVDLETGEILDGHAEPIPDPMDPASFARIPAALEEDDDGIPG